MIMIMIMEAGTGISNLAGRSQDTREQAWLLLQHGALEYQHWTGLDWIDRIRLDSTGFDWIRLDLIGFGFDWIRLDSTGFDWVLQDL